VPNVKSCMFAPELLPNRGGVGSYCLGLLRELSRTVDLTVLTPQWSLGNERYTAREIEEYFDGRLRVLITSKAADSFVYNARFQWSVFRTLPKLLKSERFDVFHSHHAHMPDILSGPFHPDIPTARTVHSTIDGQREAIREAQALGGAPTSVDQWQIGMHRFLHLAERVVLDRPRDYFIAVSRWTKRGLVTRGFSADRIGLAPCGVDPTRFRPELRSSDLRQTFSAKNIVIFPGRPTLIRGAEILAQAIPRVLAAHPDTIILITGGTTADFPQLARLSPSDRERVRLLGHLPYDKLPELFASCDIAVVPTYYDNLPIRLLEALASGVPVVASDVGGISEVVIPERTGLLIPPGSAEQLADASIRLLGDESLRDALGKAGRQLVSTEYTWARTAEATVRAYDATIRAAG
jgi:glycosyltransferase involved in cell wall biosynthesis